MNLPLQPRKLLLNEDEARQNESVKHPSTLDITRNNIVSPLPNRKQIDVAKDMEALILSRQDDPFLQVRTNRFN